MSNYLKLSKHPITGKWEEAQWLDDYFGKHEYGVKFSHGEVFRGFIIETKERADKPKKISTNYDIIG